MSRKKKPRKHIKIIAKTKPVILLGYNMCGLAEFQLTKINNNTLFYTTRV